MELWRVRIESSKLQLWTLRIFKRGNLFLIWESGPGLGGGLNLSMRPKLRRMICYQLLLLSKARKKGGIREICDPAVGASWGQLTRLKKTWRAYRHAIASPNQQILIFFSTLKEKKIHSTFCCHISFLFFPLKAPSAGLSNLFLIVRIIRANQYRFRKLNSVVLARYATANQEGTGSSPPGVCSASQTSWYILTDW